MTNTTITLALDPPNAPISVDNFVNLAESGFYDGLTFHRIMSGFMMQGGDPTGTGTGGSDKNIKGEFAANGVDNSISHKRGTISMARSADFDSASSQFFIVHQDSEFLDGQYAAFGHVVDGMDVVDAVCEAARPTDNNGTIPAGDQPVMTSVRIQRQGEAASSIQNTPPSANADEAMKSFEDFLQGNAAAKYMDGSNDTIYNTKDAVEKYNKENFGGEEDPIYWAVESITYAYTDCGNDGIPELAVSYNSDITYNGSRVYIYTWDVDEKAIKELYDYEYAPQYWADELEYGTGAVSTERGNIGKNLVEAGGEDLEVELLEYNFEAYDSENWDSIPRFYCANCDNMDLVREAFDKAGVNLYSQDEINEMIRKKLDEHNITQDMLKEVQWNTI